MDMECGREVWLIAGGTNELVVLGLDDVDGRVWPKIFHLGPGLWKTWGRMHGCFCLEHRLQAQSVTKLANNQS